MKVKRPDKKNAQSILEAAKKDMVFTLTLPVTESSASTIVRNIYECFRMLGDALLISEGTPAQDHVPQVQALINTGVSTKNRSIRAVDHLRRLRHNINYHGHKTSIAEAQDAVHIAKELFDIAWKNVSNKIKT